MTDIADIMKDPVSYAGRQIRRGKSGAEVWEIEDSYVLKCVRKENQSDPEGYSLYQKEARFYQYFCDGDGERTLPCLPEVLDVQVSGEEIGILMKRYGELSRDMIGPELLRKIMRALAQVHTWKIPDFLERGQEQPGYLDSGRIADCVDGWRSVLAEHPGEFDEKILMWTSKKINELIEWHHGERKVLSHGDFHWDNLLLKENGDIVICDWQGVNAGGASGDISFFLSRLGADGVALQPEELTECYCRERYILTKETLSCEELLRHMKAANAITTFQFWHQYLHGSTCERVRGIYEKMDC